MRPNHRPPGRHSSIRSPTRNGLVSLALDAAPWTTRFPWHGPTGPSVKNEEPEQNRTRECGRLRRWANLGTNHASAAYECRRSPEARKRTASIWPVSPAVPAARTEIVWIMTPRGDEVRTSVTFNGSCCGASAGTQRRTQRSSRGRVTVGSAQLHGYRERDVRASTVAPRIRWVACGRTVTRTSHGVTRTTAR